MEIIFLFNLSVEVESLGVLPCEVWVHAAKVTESGSLLVDGSLQVELLDDVARSEVEVVPHNPDDVRLSAAVLDSSVGFDVD